MMIFRAVKHDFRAQNEKIARRFRISSSQIGFCTQIHDFEHKSHFLHTNLIFFTQIQIFEHKLQISHTNTKKPTNSHLSWWTLPHSIMLFYFSIWLRRYLRTCK